MTADIVTGHAKFLVQLNKNQYRLLYKNTRPVKGDTIIFQSPMLSTGHLDNGPVIFDKFSGDIFDQIYVTNVFGIKIGVHITRQVLENGHWDPIAKAWIY